MAKKPGLYANIHARRKKVAASKGKLRMRRKGEKGAPSDAQFKAAAKTAKRRKGLMRG
tara:strand:+ start:316 stop:489 length:174 start_codon:yes stop_codon:yes gene_type:complete